MNIKNFVIGVAIMILTISVAVYGVHTFYKAPNYDDFCSSPSYAPRLPNGTAACAAVCVPMYEIQNGSCVFNECGSGCGPDGATSFETLKQCQTVASGKNCYDSYDLARESYSRNLFLITLPLGIVLLAIGALVFGLEAVGAGLMAGGVAVVLWGVGSFWSYADNWLKFLLSLVGLVALIWLAYYFNKKLEKKSKKK